MRRRSGPPVNKKKKEGEDEEVFGEGLESESWLKGVEEKVIFQKYMDDIAPRLALPRTSAQVIEEFSSPDVTADRVADVIKKNPYYEHLFQKHIESFKKSEDQPALESAIVLLGMQKSRDFIVALQMMRTVHQNHAEWSKEGKLELNPSELIPFALKTEDYLSRKKDGHSEIAFASGLVFDYLAQLITIKVKDPKKLTEELEATYEHSFRTAKIALEVAERIPDFSFKKYAFSACMLHDVGKIVLAILMNDYIPFTEEIFKKEIPRQVRQFAEEKRYGVSHSILGALVCFYFRIFSKIDGAILFHHTPQLIKTKNKNLYELACIIYMATNLASHFKKTDDTADPVMKIWKGDEIADHPMSTKDLAEVSQRVAVLLGGG